MRPGLGSGCTGGSRRAAHPTSSCPAGVSPCLSTVATGTPAPPTAVRHPSPAQTRTCGNRRWPATANATSAPPRSPPRPAGPWSGCGSASSEPTQRRRLAQRSPASRPARASPLGLNQPTDRAGCDGEPVEPRRLDIAVLLHPPGHTITGTPSSSSRTNSSVTRSATTPRTPGTPTSTRAAAGPRTPAPTRRVRIVARAWLHVIWRCWQNHQRYDPARHRAQQSLLHPRHRDGLTGLSERGRVWAAPGPRRGSRPVQGRCREPTDGHTAVPVITWSLLASARRDPARGSGGGPGWPEATAQRRRAWRVDGFPSTATAPTRGEITARGSTEGQRAVRGTGHTAWDDVCPTKLMR